MPEAAGLPPGVLSVVCGDGVTGALVCAAPEVARIDLTGGTRTGRAVAAAAAERLVPCTLELGGKTPVILFDDVNPAEAVAGALFSAFVAAGQTCVSGSRFLVQRALYPVFVEQLAQRADALLVGDPADPATDMGPVITADARKRCRRHIATAIEQGAHQVAGARPLSLPAHCRDGHYVAPTVMADVTPDMALFQEEVFGPVVAVTPFDDERHALELAADTPFALGASVWTRDVRRAHRVAGAVKAGVVWINDHHKNDPRSIWGGFGDSGHGKENGWDALRSYQRKRSVVVRTSDGFDDWFDGGSRYG